MAKGGATHSAFDRAKATSKQKDGPAALLRQSRAADPRRDGKAASGKKRYEAVAENGQSAWKSEWSSFMSGVRMSENGLAVNIKPCMDFQEEESTNFSYLFGSAPIKKENREKKQAKAQKEQEKRTEANRRNQILAKGGGDADALMRMDKEQWKPTGHQKLIKKAAEVFTEKAKVEQSLLSGGGDQGRIENATAVAMEGLNRKERRAAMHTAVAKAEKIEIEKNRVIKPHELMDSKLAWYQQGPSPLDEVSEKLVLKKATKHGRQQNMKYNFMKPHPSWMASRANGRKWDKLYSLGTVTHFDE